MQLTFLFSCIVFFRPAVIQPCLYARAEMCAFGVGVVFAQGTNPPANGYGMMGGFGYGPMHDYVEQALADKLGLTKAEVEAQLTSGKTMYQIALDAGIAEADVPALLQEVHKTAFDKAVADGVITREQADFMLQRMSQYGFNYGNCPMQNGTANGYGYGRGGMMGNFQGNGFGRGMMGRGFQNNQTNP